MRIVSSLILLCLFSFSLKSQNVQDKIRLIVEDYMSQNDERNVDVELIYEVLYDLYESPLNVNSASEVELQTIPFLSLRDAKALLDFRQQYGPLNTIYELQGVYGFNLDLIQNISPFISFDESYQTYKKRLYLSQEALLRTTTIVEQQEGYHRPDSLSHYEGKPYSLLLKYKGQLNKKILWHLTAEQDKGEAWFTHATTTDFLSAGVEYNGDDWIERIVLGDFRMRFGQGLIVNNNFGYGKSSQVMGVLQKGDGLRRYTSSSESKLFRGAAAHIKTKPVDIFIGLSSVKADASLDTLDELPIISSFPTTGLHRTSSEVDKYKQARISDAIIHLDYKNGNLQLGTTVAFQKLSATYHKPDRLDNIYAPIYDQYYNLGIDYKWTYKQLMFFGELATDKQNAWATVQGLMVYPSSRIALSLVYRNYAKNYHAFYGQAFGENSRVNNEEGLYLGTNLSISKAWSIASYFDWYLFPWARYGVARPSTAYDVLLQPQYAPSKKLSMYWQLKYEDKEDAQLTDSPQFQIINTQRANIRYHISAQLTEYISIQSRFASTHVLHLPGENGYLIFQDLKAKMFGGKLTATLRYAIYNTASYESRVYAYESDVLYLSSTPAFFGSGSRSYINGSYAVTDAITLYCKLAYTKSFDSETLGSALDMIDADHKTDVHLQLRVKF